MKKTVALIMAIVMFVTMVPITAFADQATVVTIGADLSQQQKDMMFKYFGVEANKVNVIEVTNAEEREYLEGVATEAQIGRKTFSCAYIQETEEGNGINVKIANLNMVDSAMIATTLTTAGIYNCNVVAASPFEVSGTGALTGILKAFEKVTGEELDEEKKELATEELVATSELAEQLESKDSATGIITSVKEQVIESGATSEEDIRKIIKAVAKAYGIDLTDEQIKSILKIMQKVAKQNYDYEKIKSTLKGISTKAAKDLDIDLDLDIDISKEDAKGFVAVVGKFFQGIGDFFKSIGNWIAGLFGGGEKEKAETTNKDNTETENKDLGILNNTDDSLLGDGAIVNSTDESTINSDTVVESKEEQTTDSSDETDTGNEDGAEVQGSEGEGSTGTEGNGSTDSEGEAASEASEAPTQE
ncbi:MAG: DUF1002 domain-containing protein [Lachnospiraceae bacterium]|nr:DUF1002 domain-containing protein [Lachnospiraceae bacterium]